jgi:hypothetical protein
MVAYLVAKVVHEAIGHGLTCVVVGAELHGVSTSWCDCDKSGVDAGAARAVKAGGTMANVFVGRAALALVRRRRERDATSYALWMCAAVNCFMAAGYLMVDPIFGFGDWTAFLEGVPYASAVRLALVASGLALAAQTIAALLPFLGSPPARGRRGLRLALLPWAVVGGGVMTAVAMANVLGPKYALTSALATIGGTSFLAWFHQLEWLQGDDRPIEVGTSRGWIAAGATALVCAVVLGRGIVWIKASS